MILNIKLLNHFLALLSLIIVAIIILILISWFGFDKASMTIFGIGLAIDAIPALYLHIEYWLKNQGEEYEIKRDEIIKRENGTETVYKNEALKKVIVYKSANMDKRGFPLLAIEYYYYARIITKDGEELIITRLLTPKVEKSVRQLRGVPYERKKRLFCTLGWK